MVKIKLAMHGRIHKPFYRIVAISERSKREGKPLETLGYWNPNENKLKVNSEKLKAWIEKGAQITDGVKKLLK